MAWGRAVKARGRARSGDQARRRAGPVLFLFLDDRLPDAAASVRRLCRVPGAAALFGIVVRASDPGRLRALAVAVAPPCRSARVLLLVSGDATTARRLGAGLHLPGALGARGTRVVRSRTPRTAPPGGPRFASSREPRIAPSREPRMAPSREPRLAPSRRLLAASAHDARAVGRARRLGVDLLFVSPVFPTASHPGQPALGPCRAARLARLAPVATAVLALGGVDGATARRLPPPFSRTGAAAVGALG